MAEPSVKCERCKITVATSKLGMRDRCCDHRCPLNSTEDNVRHEADWRRSVGQLMMLDGERAAIPPATKRQVLAPVEKRSPPPKAETVKIQPVASTEVDNRGHGARVAADLAARKAARTSQELT